MRTSRIGGLVALLGLAGACRPDGGGEGDAVETHPVLLHVLDLFEQRVEGATVASTRAGKVLDAVVTGANGEALLDAAADGELTAYAPSVTVQYHTAVTLFSVGTAAELTAAFQFWAVLPAPTPAPPTVLVTTSASGVAGATSVVANAGSCDKSGTTASGPLTVEIEDGCVQTDGRVTLHSHVQNGSGTLLAWGALPDQATSVGAATITVSDTPATTVDTQVLSAPTSWKGYASYVPFRKGQPVARFQPALASASTPIFGAEIATSIRAQAYASLGALREARITTGVAAGSPVVLDFGAALPFADEFTASVDGGVPRVSWIAPDVVGADFFLLQMGWSGLEEPYLWFAFGPDADATGARSLRMPPPPRELQEWVPVEGAEVLNTTLHFEELSFVDGYGDLAWRTLPYPEVFVHRVTEVTD